MQGAAMIEDHHIVRLNILHYQELLKLKGATRTRIEVKELLAEAKVQLAASEVEAVRRES
jgi:hypothetical protein